MVADVNPLCCVGWDANSPSPTQPLAVSIDAVINTIVIAVADLGFLE